MSAAIEEFDGVLVVGAGLVGTLAALSLAKKGYHVRLMEYRPDFRKQVDEQSSVKRSINLSLSYRGEEALRSVGLMEDVQKILIPMHGRAIHLPNSRSKSTEFAASEIQRYDEMNPENFNNSVPRKELNIMILDALEKMPRVSVRFDCKLQKVGKDLTCEFEDKQKDKIWRAKPILILGCDGAYSAVRRNLLQYNFSNFQQLYIPHGYKEFTIEPVMKNGKPDFKLPEAEYLHIWPKGDYMMIALPNPDKSFTGTLFAPIENLKMKEDTEILSYFSSNFPGFLKLVPDVVQQYKQNPTSRLVSVKLDDWAYIPEAEDRAALVLGDAAHACVPFYGQGMNCGFEDVLEFSLCLEQIESQQGLIGVPLLVEAVRQFNEKRVQDGQSCGQLSLDNYREMSHHVMSSWFLIEKKIEGWLNYFMGDRFIPLYKMVSYTRLPYTEVIEKNERQRKILNWSMNGFILVSIGAAVAGYLKLK